MKIISTITLFIVLLLAGSAVLAPLAHADGGMFYPIHTLADETDQQALIVYQGQTEDLIISASFRGNTNDFAWVIPTPSEPTISKSSANIFSALLNLTKTEPQGTMNLFPSSGLGSAPKGTIEVQQRTVGIYDTYVVKADSETVLADWLEQNGFTFPADQRALLKNYVDQGWYFAIAKIQDAFASDPAIKKQLVSGRITPLRLTFTSSQIIYPMMLTKAALLNDQVRVRALPADMTGIDPATIGTQMTVTLYVLADYRTTSGDLDTGWANWAGQEGLANINRLDGGNFIDTAQPLFLTKLAKTVNAADIHADFVLHQSATNDVYPVPAYLTGDFWITNLVAFFITLLVVALNPLGIFCVVATVLQKYFKERWVFIFGKVCAIILLVLMPLVWLIIVLGMNEGVLKIFMESGFIGFTIGLLLSIAVLACLIYHGQKKLAGLKSGPPGPAA